MKASKWFVRGVSQYYDQQYLAARASLKQAIEDDAEQPLYHYFMALAQFQLGQREEASENVRTAVALERTSPILNWGRMMERCQGPSRKWLEEQRTMWRR